MTDTALETVLRRDRIIVAGALGTIVALAWGYVLWLANDMDMGGIGRHGHDRVSHDPGWCGDHAAGNRALESYRVRLRIRHVDGDDGWDDGAFSSPNDPHVRTDRSTRKARGQTVRRDGLVRHRIFSGLGWLFTCSNFSPMGDRASDFA